MSTFVWTQRKGSGNVGTKSTFGVSMSPASSGRQFSVILYEAGMKLTRWMAGDRVLIGFDLAAGMVAIRRDPSGYTLCPNGGQSKKRKTPKSLRVSCCPDIQVRPFKRVLLDAKDAQMVDDMLVISLPKSAIT